MNSPENYQSLEQQQLRLEAEMLDAGFEHYQTMQEKNGTAPTQSAWNDHLLKVVAAVTGNIEEARSKTEGGRATRRREAARLLPPVIPSEQLALITIRQALDLLCLDEECKRSLGALVRSVAAQVKHEAARLKPAECKPWTVNQTLKVGGLLAECLFETDLLCSSRQIKDGKKKKYIIALKPDLMEWLPTIQLRSNLMPPQHLPMIVPPLDWRKGQIGGYLIGAKLRDYSLVAPKYRFDPDAWRIADQAIQWDKAGNTLTAINAMQKTSWQINEQALKAAKKVTSGGHRGDFRKQLAQTRIVDTAERFKDHDRLYFPGKLDFRARTYPRCHLLSPQGDDLKRSLLTFAEGQPVTCESDMEWLKIHRANLFGMDKAAYKERTDWVDRHSHDIIGSARDPEGQPFWQTADKPFQALAWCREYYRLRDGDQGTLTFLPCSIDGTCNTLQHFAAVMRDEVSGASINLLPGDEPRDIYAEIAKAVRMQLRLLGKPEAEALLLFGIDRKLTKKPVFTAPYGGTAWTIIKELEESLWEHARCKPQLTAIMEDKGYELAVLLHKQIQVAMQDKLKGPVMVMDWLREVTHIVADRERKNLTWTPPHGLTVTQPYVKLKKQLLRTDIGKGQTVQLQNLTVDQKSPGVDMRRAKNGISANFMHALDAVHMFETVGRAHDAGIRSFHIVHDSFGTHCTRLDDLARIAREAFVDQYDDYCPMEALLADLEKQVSRKTLGALPPVPDKGSLDLSKVLESQYFFC